MLIFWQYFFKEHSLTLWTHGKNERLCICIVLATNIVFGKQQGGSKAREIGDKIQQVTKFDSLQTITRREEFRLKYEFNQNFVKSTKIRSQCFPATSNSQLQAGGQAGSDTTIVYIRQLAVLECSRVISSVLGMQKKS